MTCNPLPASLKRGEKGFDGFGSLVEALDGPVRGYAGHLEEKEIPQHHLAVFAIERLRDLDHPPCAVAEACNVDVQVDCGADLLADVR